ncbi:peptidylprolyl isomerase [Comamonas terrigena]|jgi:peptidylprolyl isomerase|nr:peptidylprolyl isomerase [Comamonas terrigena]BBL25307.1 peptidylprolyl isomerase [Comamonas terrigena NBRC 13299]SUY71113.1 Foldase protein prsA 3 precursor [Comamonas terrigena]
MTSLTRRNGFSTWGLALAVLMGSGTMVQAAAPAAKSSEPAVATLGAIHISSAEVQQLLRAMPESERAKVKSNREGLENWLRQRLAGEAVLREAQQKKWAERPEVRARIDAAVKDVTARVVTSSYLESIVQLPAGFPSDAEVSAAYERAKPQLNMAATYRVAQIFLPVTPDADAAAIAAVRTRAAELAAQARTGDFAALAKAHSQDAASAAQGGEVGNLPLAQLLPETREMVATMQPNQISDPVRSTAGFHVLKLLGSQPARPATLEEAKPMLQAALREQRQQELINAHLSKLAPSSSVSIDKAALDAALQKVN